MCTPPTALDKTLVKRWVVFRFNAVGWVAACVNRFYPKPRTKFKYNFELRYDAGDRRDHCLSTVAYGFADNAPAGSWALLQEIENRAPP